MAEMSMRSGDADPAFATAAFFGGALREADPEVDAAINA